MKMSEVILVVEGDTDVPFAKKLLSAAGLGLANIIDRAGKDRLDEALAKYNVAAAHGGWFVLRDLDQDEACAQRSWLACCRSGPDACACASRSEPSSPGHSAIPPLSRSF